MRVPYRATGEKPRIMVGIKKEEVDVYLDDSTPNTLKQFHCPVCGSVAFEYRGSLQIIMAGKEVSAPMVVQCKNNRCKATFYVKI